MTQLIGSEWERVELDELATDLPIPGLRLEGRLGRGEAHVTYAARWRPPAGPAPARVAVRVTPAGPAAARAHQALEAALAQLRAAHRLCPALLVPLHHGMSPAGRHFSSTELYEHDLLELGVHAPRERDEALAALAAALAALHGAGLAHGNLKPTNVLWRHGPAGVAVALADPRMDATAERDGASDLRAWGELALRVAAGAPTLLGELAQAARAGQLSASALGERAAGLVGPPAGWASSAPRALSPDALAAAGFEVLGPLGEGAAAVVYRARRRGREVAVKLFRPEMGARVAPAALLDPLREIAGELLVLPLERGRLGDGREYATLPLYEGSLATAGARLDEDAVLEILGDAAAALAELHLRGLVHRDIKPSNVLVAAGLGRHRGAVADLDQLARAGGPAARSGPAGTPGFRPPEADDPGPLAPAWDLWSFGVTGLLVLGRRRLAGPIEAPPGADLAALASELRDAPIAVVELLRRCVDPDPSRRPTAAEVAATLGHELAARRARRDRITAATRAGPEPERLFHGLEPFDAAEQGHFFGRDRDRERVLALLASHAVVVVLGPSGVGKSSFLRAGLLPALERAAELGEVPFRVARVRPGSSPSMALAAARRSLEEPSQPGRPLLVVDPLEEVFTLASAAERSAFFAALDDLIAGGPPGMRAVLAIREDQYGRLLAVPPFQAGRHAAYRLGPLGEDQLRELLERPAAQHGYEWERGLSATLAGEVAGEAAALPLLQLVASELWARRDRAARLIRREELARLGGVTGAIQRHARSVLAALAADESIWEGLGVAAPARAAEVEDVVRDLMLRLVDERGQYRRLVSWSELTSQFTSVPDRRTLADRVVLRLVAHRLLTATAEPQAGAAASSTATLELVHECLISGWEDLRRWLEDERPRKRLVDEIRARALEWVEAGRAEGALWGGAHLRRQRERKRQAGVSLTSLEAEFWGACERAEGRRRRWRRATAAIAVAGLAVALVQAAWQARSALQTQEVAARMARERLARTLAREADLLRDRDPVLGLRRLMESLRIAATAEALGVARSYLDRASGLHGQHTAERPVILLAVAPDERFAASANTIGEVALWPLGGDAPSLLTGLHPVERLQFSPDGQSLWWLDAAGQAWRWDTSGGEPEPEVAAPEWLAAPAPPERPLPWPQESAALWAWGPRGDFVVAGGMNGSVQILHVPGTDAAELLRKLEALRTPAVTRLAGVPPRVEIGRGWTRLALVRVEGEPPPAPFWIGETEVTQAQFAAVAGFNPSIYQDPDYPVSNVSWSDVTLFCRQLTYQSGLPVRLPTAGEWELAARARAHGRFPWGDDASRACSYGNVLDRGSAPGRAGGVSCDDDAFLMTLVRSYQPTGIGLFDIVGNVREIVDDRPPSSVANMAPPAAVVSMGHSFRDAPDEFDLSERHTMRTPTSDAVVGFRVVVPGEAL